MEDEPQFNLDIDGEEVICTRENTALYTFLGDLATRNHIFIAREQLENGRVRGTYIFSPSNIYRGLADYLVVSRFPLHLNLPLISEADEANYQEYIAQLMEDETDDLGDFPPDFS